MWSAGHCLYCGNDIPLLAIVRGLGRFCSEEHSALYEQESAKKILEALTKADTGKPPAEEAEPPMAGLAALGPPVLRVAPGAVEMAPASSLPIPPAPRRAAVPEAESSIAGRQPGDRGGLRAGRMPIPGLEAVDVSGRVRVVKPLPAAWQLAPRIPGCALRDRLQAAACESIPAHGETMRPERQELRARQRIEIPEQSLAAIELAGKWAGSKKSGVPPAVGEPVRREVAPGTQSLPAPLLKLRHAAVRDRGVFIPGLRMGALRPRIMLERNPSATIIPISKARAAGARRQTDAEARAHSG